MTDRRSALSYLTGGAVTLGALIAGDGLMRSYAPITPRVTRFDQSDMKNGEARYYSFSTFAQLIVRRDEELHVWDGLCPISRNYPLMAPDNELIWCHHCTSRFKFEGQITKVWGANPPPADAPNLNPGWVETVGLFLLVAEDMSLPTLAWSGL